MLGGGRAVHLQVVDEHVQLALRHNAGSSWRMEPAAELRGLAKCGFARRLALGVGPLKRFAGHDDFAAHFKPRSGCRLRLVGVES